MCLYCCALLNVLCQIKQVLSLFNYNAQKKIVKLVATQLIRGFKGYVCTDGRSWLSYQDPYFILRQEGWCTPWTDLTCWCLWEWQEHPGAQHLNSCTHPGFTSLLRLPQRQKNPNLNVLGRQTWEEFAFSLALNNFLSNTGTGVSIPCYFHIEMLPKNHLNWQIMEASGMNIIQWKKLLKRDFFSCAFCTHFF